MSRRRGRRILTRQFLSSFQFPSAPAGISMIASSSRCTVPPSGSIFCSSVCGITCIKGHNSAVLLTGTDGDSLDVVSLSVQLDYESAVMATTAGNPVIHWAVQIRDAAVQGSKLYPRHHHDCALTWSLQAPHPAARWPWLIPFGHGTCNYLNFIYIFNK